MTLSNGTRIIGEKSHESPAGPSPLLKIRMEH